MHKQILNVLIRSYHRTWQGFSTQQALASLIKKWKAILDKNWYAGELLMNLSKAFETINHDLLIAKLNVFGFTKNSLRLIKSYFSNRCQNTKINTSFSSWTGLLLGVPQVPIPGPLLFNIYINDLFFLKESTNVCNYADNTTFHACDMDLENLVWRLELDSIFSLSGLKVIIWS